MFKSMVYKYGYLDTADKFYADVKYEEKDLAKDLGAYWDKENKKWYFYSETKRYDWDIKHSIDIKVKQENLSNEHIGIIDIDLIPSYYRSKVMCNALLGIAIFIIDSSTLTITRLCYYQINEQRSFSFDRIEEKFIVYDTKFNAIQDIQQNLDECQVTKLLTYNGKNIKTYLPELHKYNWYDIRPTICNKLGLDKRISLNNMAHRPKNFGYDAMTKIYDIKDIIKRNNIPIQNFYTNKI